MRFRFSLRTLLLAVLLIGSAVMLWQRWKPWLPVRTLGGHESEVFSAVFSPDGRKLLTLTHLPIPVYAITGWEEPIPVIARIWDLDRADQPPVTIRWGEVSDFWWSDYAFSADNRWLIVKTVEREYSRARIFDATTGQDLFANGDEVLDLCIPPGGPGLVAIYANKPAEVWDLEQRKVIKTLNLPAVNSIMEGRTRISGGRDAFTAQFSPDAKWVAIGNEGMLAEVPGAADHDTVLIPPFVWNVESGEKIPCNDELPAAGAFSPDSQNLLIRKWQNDQHNYCIYDLRSRSMAHYIEGAESCQVFSPDGKEFVLWTGAVFKRDSPKEFRVYDVASCKMIAAIPGSPSSHDRSAPVIWIGSRIFFSGGNASDRSRIFDMAARTSIDIPATIHPAPYGKRVFAYKWQTDFADIRDSGTGDVLAQLTGKIRIFNAAWSPDGNEIVIGGDDGEAVLWKQHRPEQWWGMFWLPEIWLTVVFAVALAFSIRRDRRAR